MNFFGSKSSNFEINFVNGPTQKFVIQSNISVTSLSNPVAGGVYTLQLVQDSSGNRQISWPVGVIWSNGAAPVLSSTPNAVDFIQFWYDGSNFYGDYQISGTTFATSSQLSAAQSSLQAEDLTFFKLDGSRSLTGDVLFSADGSKNIGASAASRPNNIYVKTSIVNAGSQSIGTTLTMAGASGANMLWTTDGAGDIGASAASRPNNVYVKTGVVASTLTADVGASGSPSILLGASSGYGFSRHISDSIFIQIANSSKIRMSSTYLLMNYANSGSYDLIWGTVAGAGSIGQNSSNAPVNILARTNITSYGTLVMGAASGANLTWSTDGAGDIGASAASRPNNVYVKTNINLGSLTASRALVSDASNNLVSSAVTSTELGYLSGVTSAVQTQLNSEASARAAEDLTFFKKDGSRAMTGAMNMASYSLSNVGDVSFVGGQKVYYQQKSANYTLLASDYCIGISSLASSVTITLPSAATVGAGKVFIIKDQTGLASGSTYVRIAASGSETVDGSAYYDINAAYESAFVVSNGTNWFLL